MLLGRVSPPEAAWQKRKAQNVHRSQGRWCFWEPQVERQARHIYLPSPLCSPRTARQGAERNAPSRWQSLVVWLSYQQWCLACSWNHLLRIHVNGSVYSTGRNDVPKCVPQIDGRAHSHARISYSQATRLAISSFKRWTFKRWKSFPSFLWLGFITLLTPLLIYLLYMLLIAFSIYYCRFPRVFTDLDK